MLERFRQFASQRTQSEWKLLIREYQTNLRIWLQEHGEKAFLAGLVLGFLLIIFIKVVAFIVAIAVVLAVLIWEFAPKTKADEVDIQEMPTTNDQGTVQKDND